MDLLVRRVMQKKLAWEPRGTKEVAGECRRGNGENKRRAVSLWMDRCARALSQRRGEGKEKKRKKVNADVLINGRNFKILT